MHKLLVISIVVALAACSRPESEPATPTLTTPAAPLEVPATSPPAVDDRAAARASVLLVATAGNTANGTLDVIADGNGVRIRGELHGLDVNSEHGFHIHEFGDCTAEDASSAGGHFNPHGLAHGRPGEGEHHAGDLFNLRSDGSGNASVDALASGVGLRSGAADDVIGKAVVVHKKADDYVSQPAGDSGPRIACGVIL